MRMRAMFDIKDSLDRIFYKYPDLIEDKKLSYGTAGYRGKSSLLNTVIFRVGIAVALRSRLYLNNDGLSTTTENNFIPSIGVMITASHNPIEDNGIKVINSNGEMLESYWENIVTFLVNSKNNELIEKIMKIIDKYKINTKNIPIIFVGRDNRESGITLYENLRDGIKVIGDSLIVDLGEVTTPLLHFVVKYINIFFIEKNDKFNAIKQLSREKHILIYLKTFINAYNHFINQEYKNHSNHLIIDVAHGVGGNILQNIKQFTSNTLKFKIVNYSNKNLLNYKCGSDYVKLNCCFPKIDDTDVIIDKNCRIASFDGDGDRLVYSFLDANNEIIVFDGDDICALLTYYIYDLLSNLNKENEITLGVIHTAYSNGGVINYLKSLKNIQLICAPTGVKYLHKEAKKYDIGIYFESNGHGTVLYNYNNIVAKLHISNHMFLLSQSPYHNPCVEPYQPSNQKKFKSQCGTISNVLVAFLQLSNQAVGDALSNLLMVEAILNITKSNLYEFTQRYCKLKTHLGSLKVNDKYSFLTNPNNEANLLKPSIVQHFIDEMCNNYQKYQLRAFVRPSGTEDIVRIYVESVEQCISDECFEKIKQFIIHHSF